MVGKNCNVISWAFDKTRCLCLMKCFKICHIFGIPKIVHSVTNRLDSSK